MERKGYTAANLSRLTGVSKQNLSSWLMGRNPRSLADLKLAARELGTTIDELLFGEEPDGPSRIEADATSVEGEFHDEHGNIFRGRFLVTLVVKKLRERNKNEGS
jgi:transcriptional regulator with XRE-family HTH domain